MDPADVSSRHGQNALGEWLVWKGGRGWSREMASQEQGRAVGECPIVTEDLPDCCLPLTVPQSNT